MGVLRRYEDNVLPWKYCVSMEAWRRYAISCCYGNMASLWDYSGTMGEWSRYGDFELLWIYCVAMRIFGVTMGLWRRYVDFALLWV